MSSILRRPRVRTAALSTLCTALALGWAGRELSIAQDKAAVKSQTVALEQVQMSDFRDRGSVVGKVGIYLAGDTPASTKFVTGRLVLDAGKTPHPPHTHPEEEIMVIEQGHGEIDVAGKITKVGPGSVMYTAPEVSHGIVNTGDTPIVFYFVKWAGKDTK